ncbi:hypothetical protein IDH50_06815 [Aeromicrobium tamlense]|uniref:Uncharacterized protein n=1 Tax=Aeromicrobium tamlense TaxID=375541 RepID=A0A8I0KMP3_9ACTN|nr:hypothetical protein [Aeromicrobium tamlense]MBD1269934.1 hypothetical protein [Aeromicrobium tamlense]NYI39409.1 hypothetical protein [Aeromicrobium tamlense]
MPSHHTSNTEPASGTNRRRRRGVLLSLALVVGLLSAASSAQAREATTPDPAGGGSSAFDLYKVKVVNNAKGVRVTVRMKPVDWNAESTPVGEFRLLLDTNHKSAGAEFADEVGIPGDGGFRALKGSTAHRESWVTYPFPGTCGKTVRERYDLENGIVVVHVKPKKGCLYHPKYVRVNVRSIQSGYIDDSGYHTYTPARIDHLPYKNSFTPWVKYSRK